MASSSCLPGCFRAALLLAGTTFAGTAAAAPANIDRIEVIEGDGGYAVVSYEGGMLLLKADGTPHRVYRYKAIKEGPPDRMRVVDVDGDGRGEIFGLGLPTFMLNKKGDPVWDVAKGCQGFAVANVMGEPNKKELVCASGGSLIVSTRANDRSDVPGPKRPARSADADTASASGRCNGEAGDRHAAGKDASTQ